MVGVVLKQQMTILGIAEIGVVAVFAIRYKSIPFLGIALVLHYFDTVEPVLDVIAVNIDHCGVEVVKVEIGVILLRRNQVIE